MTAPHPADLKIGALVRRCRIQRSLTQEQLGSAVGVKFQQIQKYETGANRISASRLYDIAQTLNFPVGDFFNNIGEDDKQIQQGFTDGLKNPQAIEFVQRVFQLPPGQRGTLSKLLQSLATMYGTEHDQPHDAEITRKQG